MALDAEVAAVHADAEEAAALAPVGAPRVAADPELEYRRRAPADKRNLVVEVQREGVGLLVQSA